MNVPATDRAVNSSWAQSIRPASVTLRVTDPAAIADYYAALTAMEIRDSGPDRFTLGASDGGPVLLELIRSERPGPSARRAAGLFHTAFLYPDRRGLGAALKRMAGGGFNVSGASDHLVSEALYLDDPDGIGIELYRDRPRREWQAGWGNDRVAMDTLPLDLQPIFDAAPAGAEPAGEGIVVGHIHLKVGDLEKAREFWGAAVGMDLMAEYGPSALFYSSGGYHHHVGANTWFSAGEEKEPDELPGLARITFDVAKADELESLAIRLANTGFAVEREGGEVRTRTPDGVPATFRVVAG